jgi:hypothetical protein
MKRLAISIKPPPDSPYGDYLRRIGADGTLQGTSLTVVPSAESPARALEHLRRSAGDALATTLPEPEAGLAAGILIGLRDRLRAKNLYDTGRGPLDKPPFEDPDVSRHLGARMINGTYNDLDDPLMGSLGSRFGRKRMVKLAGLVSRNMAAWATNVALGFMLGLTPVLGAFFGLPFRHICYDLTSKPLRQSATSAIGGFAVAAAF